MTAWFPCIWADLGLIDEILYIFVHDNCEVLDSVEPLDIGLPCPLMHTQVLEKNWPHTLRALPLQQVPFHFHSELERAMHTLPHAIQQIIDSFEVHRKLTTNEMEFGRCLSIDPKYVSFHTILNCQLNLCWAHRCHFQIIYVYSIYIKRKNSNVKSKFYLQIKLEWIQGTWSLNYR